MLASHAAKGLARWFAQSFARSVLAALAPALLAVAFATPPGIAQERAKLTVVFSPDLTEQIQASVERFLATHPGVEVEVQAFQGDRAEHVLTRQAAGLPIDIIEASTTISPSLIAAGISAELGERLARDPDIHLSDFAPGAVRPFTRADGSVYALPIDLRMYVVVINLDRVDAVGLANPNALTKSDWNWERLAEYLRLMTTYRADGGVERFGAAMRWDAPFTFTYQAGGRFVDHPTAPSESRWLTPEVVRAFEFVESLMLPNPYVRVDGNITNHAHMQMGATTKGASDLMTTGLRYDLIRWPTGPVNDAMVVGSTGVMLNAQSRHPETAWALLKHLLTDEAHTLESIRNTMRPAAYLPHLHLYSPANFPEGLPPGFAMLPEFVANPNLDTAPAFDGWEEIVSRYQDAIRRDLPTGNKSPRQILEELDRFTRAFLPAK